jgi:uncharacterized protein involved in exopolysaccharide biosynthesis
MEGQEIVVRRAPTALSWTLRDVVAMGFRRRHAALLCFFGVLAGTFAYVILTPEYRAETKILVRRQRVDEVATAEQNQPVAVSSAVAEEEMGTEVELIRSDDVLRKVVTEVGLDKPKGGGGGLFHRKRTQKQLTDGAIAGLRGRLVIEALPKTDIIRISYTASDPVQAAQVLDALNAAYLDANREMHQSKGQLEFFDQQAQNASQQLQAAEEKLKEFPAGNGTANPSVARDYTLQKLTEFNYNLGTIRQSIAETQSRITSLEQLSKTTAPRLTTQMREADAGQVLQLMKSSLLTLQLKRSDMASKYQPDYPPLKELDREIAATQGAISNEKPLGDVTTDQNPAYVWIQGELAKAKADLRGYQAGETETEAIIRQTMDSARQLNSDSIQQQDLVRTAKAAEDNYILYSRKREEARIDEALDKNKILNLAVAEKPAVPSFPAQSPMMLGLFGTILAFAATAGLVFTLEYMDPSFRTPNEVRSVLNVPLLAAVPDQNTGVFVLTTEPGSGSGDGQGGPFQKGEAEPNPGPA